MEIVFIEDTVDVCSFPLTPWSYSQQDRHTCAHSEVPTKQLGSTALLKGTIVGLMRVGQMLMSFCPSQD